MSDKQKKKRLNRTKGKKTCFVIKISLSVFYDERYIFNGVMEKSCLFNMLLLRFT